MVKNAIMGMLITFSLLLMFDGGEAKVNKETVSKVEVAESSDSSVEYKFDKDDLLDGLDEVDELFSYKEKVSFEVVVDNKNYVIYLERGGLNAYDLPFHNIAIFTNGRPLVATKTSTYNSLYAIIGYLNKDEIKKHNVKKIMRRAIEVQLIDKFEDTSTTVESTVVTEEEIMNSNIKDIIDTNMTQSNVPTVKSEEGTVIKTYNFY